MNDLDELLHSALSADRVGTSLDGDVRSVLARGRHLRQRKTAIAGVAGTVAVAALAVVGFAALSPESAVRQVPATDASVVEAPAPAVTDPAVVEPSTTDTTDVAATATSTEPGESATVLGTDYLWVTGA
jgi:hypothetical protein